jgi:DNA-directed RNA polymerase specialized sigma24 family protein
MGRVQAGQIAMSEAAAGSITQVFHRLQSGDAAAAGQLWERFFPRLLGLARRSLAGGLRRAADADDAVQSAFACFFERVRREPFDGVLDRRDLWNLLAAFTVRKSLKQARRERAARRGGGRVLGEGDLTGPGGQPLPLDGLAGRLPCADLDLACEELLQMLDDEERTIALLRLLGYRNREIAERLGCTERKVERKLNLIRLTWQEPASA